MPRFSANIGFLWAGLPLPERIRAAAAAGFEAVECHFPYEVEAADVAKALQETGLPMLGLNTRLGINGADDFGVAARPDRIEEARQYIDEALAYAAAIGCRNINVVPGRTGRSAECETTYRANLAYACERAATQQCGVLIEPINTRSAPDFHVSLVEQAIETIESVGKDNLRLMFDTFHIQIMQGDLLTRLTDALPHLGHIQISAVHDRGEPDQGEVDHVWLLGELETLGWQGFIGAEYQPRTTVEEGLCWMDRFH